MKEMQGIIARIQASSAALTQTEQRLVSELLRQPRDVALETAAEFAARVGAHEATTSRLARKLGFDSYALFRDALRRDYLHRSEPAGRLSVTIEDSAGSFLSRLIADETLALSQIADHIDDNAIESAAAHLDARRIFMFAEGNASVLAAMMDRRLRRMGVETHLLSGSPRDLAEQALTIGQGDALILFAFRRRPRGYAPLMRLAQEVGAVTLAVSDTIGPALQPAPQMLLAAPRTGAADGFQTLTVPMVLCNALILAIGARRGDAALDPLDRLGRLIDDFSSAS
ncbi:MurR/RpiR family transcriptional regulator [Falsirhodobacter sp. 20TX0035]|uniref:MurR/RpiR family transcriptional regulator n=1 Tax=Falsirhodobacter sp. 20TX0035 TaxID=3022019 RepID=UPI00232C978F|nr:MurR/RpiR family transcriptional regulator [Falsirhodobacter sp. 20TX0035]MDB6454126.1 MurR/RpiR family transcriptional regulator [Falsirhodobacter sp. 20TX0035]